MNEVLVANYNAVVKPGDLVYFLGDFSFVDPAPWVRRLNGHKHLIIGNHDQKLLKEHKRCPWAWIKEVYELKTDINKIWLAHYPHRSWPSSYHGAWHLYGHTHGLLPDTDQSLDVGADPCLFRPISLEQITAQLRHPDVTKAMEPEQRYRLAKAPEPKP